jgi:AraC-like DNA-binding protein
VVTLDQAGWNRAMVVLFPAPPLLSDLVEFLWVDERPRWSPRRHEWRVVADDAAHVIYARFRDEHGVERQRLHVVGARTRYVDVDCSHRLLTLGARLKPGALPALFRVHAAELTNRSVPAELLVRGAARDALARAARDWPSGTPTPVTSFIAELAARGRPLDRRASSLRGMALGGSIVLRDLAGQFGIGDRALRAWCATHLGVGLRRFLRIRRLHAALERRLQRPAATWSMIAAGAGFADQSHLVRDFRSLLGESPSEFFARAG